MGLKDKAGWKRLGDVQEISEKDRERCRQLGMTHVEEFLAQAFTVPEDLRAALGLPKGDFDALVRILSDYVDPEYLEKLKKPVPERPLGALPSEGQRRGESIAGVQLKVRFKNDAAVAQIQELLVRKFSLLLPEKIHEGRTYTLVVARGTEQEWTARFQEEDIVVEAALL